MFSKSLALSSSSQLHSCQPGPCTHRDPGAASSLHNTPAASWQRGACQEKGLPSSLVQSSAEASEMPAVLPQQRTRSHSHDPRSLYNQTEPNVPHSPWCWLLQGHHTPCAGVFPKLALVDVLLRRAGVLGKGLHSSLFRLALVFWGKVKCYIAIFQTWKLFTDSFLPDVVLVLREKSGHRTPLSKCQGGLQSPRGPIVLSRSFMVTAVLHQSL